MKEAGELVGDRDELHALGGEKGGVDGCFGGDGDVCAEGGTFFELGDVAGVVSVFGGFVSLFGSVNWAGVVDSGGRTSFLFLG